MPDDPKLLHMIRLACRMRSLLSRVASDAQIASVYRRQSAECVAQLDKAADWIFTGSGPAPPIWEPSRWEQIARAAVESDAKPMPADAA